MNDQLIKNFANKSLQKMFKTLFILGLMFIVNPFVAYLIFKNKGAIDVTFTNLLQIYGYSLAIFVPVSIISCVLISLSRLRLFLILVSGAISLYYMYKETYEYVKKYIDADSYKYLSGYAVGMTGLF